MNVDLNESQKKLLLETLAIAYQIEILKGKDTSGLEKIIEKFADSLIEGGEKHIFVSVFQEVKNED